MLITNKTDPCGHPRNPDDLIWNTYSNYEFLHIGIFGKLVRRIFNQSNHAFRLRWTAEISRRVGDCEQWINDDGQLHRIDGPAHITPRFSKWYLNDMLHREDGPATNVSGPNGRQEWFINGKRHRLDGPAMTWPNGSQQWWVNGLLHRIDGPALTRLDGTAHWYKNGCLHRTDGPALNRPDGSAHWYKNGCLHRADGPAIVNDKSNPIKTWYINGEYVRTEVGEWINENKIPADRKSWTDVHHTMFRLRF